jgi:threonylcarbamoyladenosine tRNA methylthiotransferase MtaB
MKSVALETVGCRLNQYETERIAHDLCRSGLMRVPFDQEADLYIVNTCTVTGRADATCRNIISRVTRRRKRSAVVVIGCYVSSDPQSVRRLSGVDLVIDNNNKENVPLILRQKFPGLFEDGRIPERSDSITGFYQHNRAWIKIGDGCNQRCSYCIIPLVRGGLTNRPTEQIINEINTLADNDYHEVVLTGIHIGQYRYGDIKSPAELLQNILARTGISRIRISSIEPQEVGEDLIKAMAGGGRRICRHLHIPLQSGSDRILKAMRRPYDTGRYLEIIRKVKNGIENIVIGADIIVGFPGETDNDFQESVAIAESGLIDYLHVFSYSDRAGTDASGLPGKINPEIIKKRNSILRDISDKQYALALKREIGHTANVISEHRTRGKNHYWGISDNYLKVAIPEGAGGGREILKIKVTGSTDRYLMGELI